MRNKKVGAFATQVSYRLGARTVETFALTPPQLLKVSVQEKGGSSSPEPPPTQPNHYESGR